MENEFTSEEWAFFANEFPMALKQSIFKKADQKLADLNHVLQIEIAKLKDEFPALNSGQKLSSKIYRGDNYNGLPWLAMDCPGYYGKGDSIAFRILVVWGKGIFFQAFSEINVAFENEKETQKPMTLPPPYFTHTQNRWIQHVDGLNQKQLSSLDEAVEARRELGFTRLIYALPLESWNDLETSIVVYHQNLSATMMDIIRMHQGA